ncbi:MAG: hypothetical protein ACP6IU_02050 [Candidatus Asgardarchaeia archaeon]
MKKWAAVFFVLLLIFPLMAGTMQYYPLNTLTTKNSASNISATSTSSLASPGVQTANISNVYRPRTIYIYGSNVYLNDLEDTDYIYIYNDSIVTIDSVRNYPRIYVYDSAKVEIINSYTGNIYLYNQSECVIRKSRMAGYIIYAHDSASITADELYVSDVYLYENATLRISNSYIYWLFIGTSSDDNANAYVYGTEMADVYIFGTSSGTFVNSRITHTYLYDLAEATFSNNTIYYLSMYNQSFASSDTLRLSAAYIYQNSRAEFSGIYMPFGGNIYQYEATSVTIKDSNIVSSYYFVYDNSTTTFENTVIKKLKVRNNAQVVLNGSNVNELYGLDNAYVLAEKSDIYSLEYVLYFTGGSFNVYNSSIVGSNLRPYDYYVDQNNANYHSTVNLKDCDLSPFKATIKGIYAEGSSVVTLDYLDSLDYVKVTDSAVVTLKHSTVSDVYVYSGTVNIGNDTDVTSVIYVYNDGFANINELSASSTDVYIYDQGRAKITSSTLDDIYVKVTDITNYFTATTPLVEIYSTTLDTVTVDGYSYVYVNDTTINNDVYVYNNCTLYLNNTSVDHVYWTLQVLDSKVLVDSDYYVTSGSNRFYNTSWIYASYTRNNTILESVSYTQVYTSSRIYYLGGDSNHSLPGYTVYLLKDAHVKVNGSYTSPAGDTATSVDIFAYDSSSADIYDTSISNSLYLYNSSSVYLESADVYTNVYLYDSSRLTANNTDFQSSTILAIESSEIIINKCINIGTLESYGSRVEINGSIVDNLYISTNLVLTHSTVNTELDTEPYYIVPYTLESYHPYRPYEYKLWKITVPGATSISAFLAELNLASGTYLRIRDAEFNLISTYDSSSSGNQWTSFVDGNTMYIELTASGSTDYGFLILALMITNGTAPGTVTVEHSTMNGVSSYLNLPGTYTYTDFKYNVYIYGFAHNMYNSTFSVGNHYLDIYNDTTIYMKNVTLAHWIRTYDTSVATLENITIASYLHMYDNSSVTIKESTCNSPITLNDYSILYFTNSDALSSLTANEYSKIIFDLWNSTITILFGYSFSDISGTVRNSTFTSMTLNDNTTVTLTGNSTYGTIIANDYSNLTLYDAVNISLIKIYTSIKPYLSGDVWHMYSHVWINGVSTLQNDTYSGNYEVYATGPFVPHKVITRNLYLDGSDKLTLINATFDDGTIYVRDNAEIIMFYNVSFYNLFAFDNAYIKMNNLVTQYSNYAILLGDSAKLVANATMNPTTLASILAYNSSSIWLKNISITTSSASVYITDNVELHLLDATQTQITYLYSTPFYNSSGIFIADFTRTINTKIYSEDYTSRYITISYAYLYGAHVELYDAQISELDLDSCSYAYFENVSVSTLYAGIIQSTQDYDSLGSIYYIPSFNTSAIFRNSTISTAKAYSITPVEFINSTITNLYYAYVVDNNNKLNISYDMNQTEIITSGAGYVAYVNTTSTITSKQLRALIAKDNGQISFSRVVLGGTTTDSLSVTRTRSDLSPYWSSYGSTHYNETFYMTKTGVSDITVTVTTISWPEESIQNVTIEVLDYAGSWHTIYKMVDTSGSLSSLSLSYDNITEMIGSLAYGLRVWVIINDTNTGTIESDNVIITASYSIDYMLDYLVSMDTASIYATKSYLDHSSNTIRIYGLDNSHIRINESTYIGDYAYLYMLENSEFYANNTLTDMTYPFLENTTARGVYKLYTFEEASATLIKAKQDSTLYYRAYHSSSLSIFDSDLPSTYLYMYPEGNSIHLTVHNSVFRSLDSPSPSDYDGDIIADIGQ